MPVPHGKCADRMAGFAFSCFPKKIDIPVALQNEPFDAYQTSARLAHVLRRSGIRVLGDLQGRKVGDFAWQKNCGFNTLHELDSLVRRVQSLAENVSRAGNGGRVRCATYRRVRGSSGIVDFTRAGDGEALAPRKSISSCQNQRPDLRRDWSAIWLYASAGASGHRQCASRSQEDLGSTSAVSPQYGEASLVAFKCFRVDAGIARAMGR